MRRCKSPALARSVARNASAIVKSPRNTQRAQPDGALSLTSEGSAALLRDFPESVSDRE